MSKKGVSDLSDELRIKITGSLDSDKTQKQIQSQLSTIENKLNLQLGIDTKLIQDVAKQVKALQQSVNKQSQGIRIIDDKEVIANIDKVQNKVKQVFSSADEAVKKFSDLGRVKLDTNLDPVTKELESFTISLKRADDTIEKMKFSLSHIGNGSDLKKVFERTDFKISDNRQAIAEKVRKEEQQINSTIAKQNEKLEQQLLLFKQQADVNTKQLRRKYNSSDLDNKAINEYLRQVNALTTNTPRLKQQMDSLNMSFKDISQSVKTATSHTLSFSDKLSTAFTSISLWGIATAGVYGTIRKLKESIQEIIEIDSQLISLDRVSNGQIDLNKALQDSINLADELGNKIGNILDGMTTFSQAGFRGEDLTVLTEYATLLSNISDLDLTESSSSIMSALKGFNMEAKDTLHYVNAINEVDNNYSVSSKILAESLMKSAGAAQTYGVSMENAIGKCIADLKSLLIDLELLTSNVEDNKAQASFNYCAA